MTDPTGGAERALRDLDEHQREAVLAVRGPVCVLAGAGSGKTRVITHRIAYGVDSGMYSPSRVMAVTFTTRAAGEMRGRLRSLGIEGVSARTFHAAALAQLNYFWPTVAGGESAPPVLSNKVRALSDAASGLRLTLDGATLRDVASEIEWRKVTLRTIEDYARAGRPGLGRLSPDAVVALHEAYEKLKDERRQLDFEDILLACAGMIESEPRVARAVREQYRHFTVDEYQDVSPLQERLLGLWLGERNDLCVVGDASQTIYSFAGADPRFLLDFERHHPGALMVRLERNYRSEPPVLATANALMRGRPGALELVAAGSEAGSRGGEADAASSSYAPSAPAARSNTPRSNTPRSSTPRPNTPETQARPPATTAMHPDDDAEATAVARNIKRRLDGGETPEGFAVLYRAHSQSAALQRALAAHDIAATVLGGKRFFELPEVRDAVLVLRGESVAGGSGDLVPVVRDLLRSRGYTETPPPAGGALRDAWEARATLLRLAENAPPGTTLRAFTDDLQARARDQHDPGLRTVTLATIHAAKGLEWDHVHVIGLSEGLLPISYARGLEQIDEERRLLYVAITRARRSVSLSWSAGNGRAEREPSRFLQELGIRTHRAAGASSVGARPPR
ncbi:MULTISPECIES: ATP-dependent helicase [unclassified Microbacterium]|uniref:ATP-dependent helicase n=1 Tax=unclassified Microbacterium TaxID=2609290 RepID=UPI000C2C7132|nr:MULTISPECIES: ATP-dependent helicase [unclassified Microbacterium]